jgi:hypothetical protein
MRILLFFAVIVFCGSLSAQEIRGSWKLTEMNGQKLTDREVVRIYQDGYFAYGSKETGTNNFLNAGGGEYSIEGSVYKEIRDFDTETPGNIGSEISYILEWKNDNQILISEGPVTWTWERISANKDDLTGTWVITGRKRGEEIRRSTPGDRRTVKILSGDRFQWIAFNSATKEFSGTGGGTYTAESCTYTENIEFFSRDDSRVGASLEFQYEIKDGEWHHKGLSSKGEPIYEIWSPYREAYKK